MIAGISEASLVIWIAVANYGKVELEMEESEDPLPKAFVNAPTLVSGGGLVVVGSLETRIDLDGDAELVEGEVELDDG
jgi:hypothetical protein